MGKRNKIVERGYHQRGRNIMRLLPLCFAIHSVFSSCQSPNGNEGPPTHIKVFYEEGMYGGWPANWGVWSWDNEILVGFTQGRHMEKDSHTFDRSTSKTKFARSMDGGFTWSIEDGYEHGITEATFEHNIGELSVPARMLTDSIDFHHPDFAFTFRLIDLINGPSSFYYSYDRGKNWEGAYQLNIDFGPKRPSGITTRTDYIVDGQYSMTAFLTVGFVDGDNNWREVACVRTEDGGLTWKLLSWISPEKVNSIMPGSVRLDESTLLVMIRQTKPPEMTSYLSKDNGLTWNQLPDPVTVDTNGNPPALLKLKDGRLCLVYGLREKYTRPEGIGMYVTYSSDEGQSWTEPKQLRGQDGAVWDIGYPRAVELPDGMVVALYYYNNADTGDPYRYIAATCFDPKKY
ncbi:MAG: sialidase family protein [Bacteroidota bacterium]